MSVEPMISILPPDLASQIAAGEVVERPASAVKELVENALDAQASRVDVSIEGGGIAHLAVSDDGVGMHEADARLCVERHATSKLRTIADLSKVKSFGFRGEALPSIASVSRFCLRTRPQGTDAGTEVLVEGGATPVLRPAGLAVGTQVEVNDLFFNVPARRKFLRSTGTESGHVTDVVEWAALSRPDVSFTLTRDGRRVREFLRAKDRAERVRQVCTEDDLAPCLGERGPLRIEAFLSRPESARSGAGGLRLLVNGRAVRDRALAVTVAQAYGSVLERGRYPRGVVYLDLPVEFVDVNVHPQKAEVRFAEPRAITDAVYSVLSRALTSAFSLPEAPRSTWARPQQKPIVVHGTRIPQAMVAAAQTATPDYEPVTLSSPPEPVPLVVRDNATPAISSREEPQWSKLRFIAQLRQTYLLCEGVDGIFVIDQHAAAERVTFTRLRRAYQTRSVPSQALLFPATIDVTPIEAELIEQRGNEIADVGLDVRLRAADSASIHAVPKLLQRANPERLVRELLSELSHLGGREFSAAIDLGLATMACHGSLRAGDAVSAEEAKALLASLDEADFAGHCPHGRPIVTTLSWAELERKVGRR